MRFGKGRVEDWIVSDNIAVNPANKIIELYKDTLTVEDSIAVNFALVLAKADIKYAIVAGYVAILFGRTRRSDEIDFVVEPLSADRFSSLCMRLAKAKFELMQGNIFSLESVNKIYRSYISQGHSVRFMYKDIILPNIEFKLISSPLHMYGINNAYTVVLNGEYRLKISPVELQIAYKLYLGSDKDIGDAVFLYTLLKPAIGKKQLRN